MELDFKGDKMDQILIVDDDPAWSSRNIELPLKPLGIDIHSRNTISSGLEAIETGEYSLVFLNFQIRIGEHEKNLINNWLTLVDAVWQQKIPFFGISHGNFTGVDLPKLIDYVKSNYRGLFLEFIYKDHHASYPPELRKKVKKVLGNKNTNQTNINNILFLAADPTDLSMNQSNAEYDKIETEHKLTKSKHKEMFSISRQTTIRKDIVRRIIFENNPYILHFSGHGKSSGEICFENNNGIADPVKSAGLV
jgi:hypothetical protein